jgi:hypothetical protein
MANEELSPASLAPPRSKLLLESPNTHSRTALFCDSLKAAPGGQFEVRRKCGLFPISSFLGFLLIRCDFGPLLFLSHSNSIDSARN